MTLENVKKIIKVDFDDDDEYISLLIEVAKEYIIDAVGRYCDKNARMKLLLCAIVGELYDNRLYTVEQAGQKASYLFHSIILQLQLEEPLEDEPWGIA